MVDLADGRVLGEQLALAPAELTDVTQEQDRAGPLTSLGQGDRPHRYARATHLDLGAPRSPPGHDQCQPLIHGFFVTQYLGGDPGQRGPDDVTHMPQTMDGRDGVRARVVHRPVCIEENHTVTDPGRTPTLTRGSTQGGKLPRRDHPRERVRTG